MIKGQKEEEKERRKAGEKRKLNYKKAKEKAKRRHNNKNGKRCESQGKDVKETSLASIIFYILSFYCN